MTGADVVLAPSARAPGPAYWQARLQWWCPLRGESPRAHVRACEDAGSARRVAGFARHRRPTTADTGGLARPRVRRVALSCSTVPLPEQHLGLSLQPRRAFQPRRLHAIRLNHSHSNGRVSRGSMISRRRTRPRKERTGRACARSWPFDHEASMPAPVATIRRLQWKHP
jgi:hypothetical protein